MAVHILLIDDSELILQMLEMVCQQAGYRSTTCAIFADVASKASLDIDLIITDLNMPDIPGGDPVAALRQIEGLASKPIILLSGQPSKKLQAEAQERGAEAALSKDDGLPGLMVGLPPLVERFTS